MVGPSIIWINVMLCFVDKILLLLKIIEMYWPGNESTASNLFKLLKAIIDNMRSSSTIEGSSIKS